MAQGKGLSHSVLEFRCENSLWESGLFYALLSVLLPFLNPCTRTHTACVWQDGMPSEVLKSSESHDLAPVEYFSALRNDSLFVHTALPGRLFLYHRGGRESEQRLCMVMAKLELNFSPPLPVGSHGASDR